MNKKIINYYNENIEKIFFAVSGFILTVMFFFQLSSVGSHTIFNIIYPTNKFVIAKNFIFIACSMSIFITLFFCKYYKDDLTIIMLAMVSYAVLFLVEHLVLSHFKPLGSILVFASFGIIPILLYFPIYTIYNRCIDFHYIRYILFIFSVFSAILPLLIGNHLNSESYFQPEVFKHLMTIEKNVSIEFSLQDPQDEAILKQRIINKYGSGFNQQSLPFFLDASEKNHYRIIAGIGNDLSSYCFFINISEYEGFKKFENCLDKLSMDSKNSIFVKRNYIYSESTFNQGIQDKYIEKLDEFLGNKNKWSIGDNIDLIKLMLVRGGVFHHYASIINGVMDTGFSSFYNQYGLGPITFVNEIARAFNFTPFDSIFYSVVFLNIILLFIILMLFGLEPIILFGYISSILSIFLISNDIAPFLYFIRFLPVTILTLIYAKYGIPAFKISAQCLLESLLLIIIGIYNKEYAIFTAISIILTGLVSQDYKYSMRAILILVPLSICLYFIPSSHVSGANFIALLSGIGFDGSLKPDSIVVFGLLLFLFSYIVYHSVNSKPILIVSILLSVFFYKYVTNTSLNHFGPLFLYVFLIVYLLKKSGYCLEKYSIYFPFFCTFLLLVIALPNINTLYHEKKFKGVQYKSNFISNRFFIDKSLIHLGESLVSLGIKDYCLISQQDDFLRIYTQKYVTSNLPNISTNINFPIDAYNALHSYKNCKYFVIENSLLNNELEGYLLKNIYNRDVVINSYISGYINDRKILKNFLKMAISNRRYHSANSHFTVYQ